jgi:hypothetical protein
MVQETTDGVPICDGFDFPVGPRVPNGDVFQSHKIDTVLVDPNYFKNLGFWHPGEDWNGKGGGDSDLGEPIYAIAHGRVTDFGHYPVWGNIVLLEHALPDDSRVWSQYAHLDQIMINQVGQKVNRGHQIGTMGKGDQGRYLAHLHFEIRKNKLPINSWGPVVKDRAAVLTNYHNPTEFITARRPGSLGQAVSPGQSPQPAQEIVRPVPTQIVIQTHQNEQRAGVFQRANAQGWQVAANGFRGHSTLWAYATAQQGTIWGEWRPSLPTAGTWEVWAYIPQNHATTTYARYQVVHADGQTEVPVNQAGYANNWAILGSYRFEPGQGYVRLTNFTGEFGRPRMVGFDAICFTRVG